MYTGDTVCYNSCQKSLQDSNKDLDKQFVLTLFYLYVILILVAGCTTVHQYQDVPGGFSEEDGEEVLHYYYGRHYNH